MRLITSIGLRRDRIIQALTSRLVGRMSPLKTRVGLLLALMVGTQALGKIILRILHGFGSKIEKVEIMKTIRVEKKILGL